MTWTKAGAFSMAAFVLLGAFGAHGLKETIGEDMYVYKTATYYHALHGLALFIVSWLSGLSQDKKIGWAGKFFVLGTILFSGSLYALAVTKVSVLGAITPFGGLCFVGGWLLLGFSKIKREDNSLSQEAQIYE